MCNKKRDETTMIEITVEEIILTPLTCSFLVNEILKYLVYQKSLIPYPYNWLRCAINKKRNSGDEAQHRASFSVQRHYQMASTAFDTMEQIMKHVTSEFQSSEAAIQEVMVIFGSTPYTAKEIITIRIPVMATGHNETIHRGIISKNQHKVLRNIVLSERWLSAMEGALPSSTNMYLMLNKSTTPTNNGFFIPNKDYSVPIDVKNTIISLHYKEDNANCCNQMQVFEDDGCEVTNTDNTSTKETKVDEVIENFWYQANVLLKGFKDSFINKVSASELW